MISIGTVLKGSELSSSVVDQTMKAVTKAFSELRGDFVFGSSPALYVVFHVPGSMGCPDWDGLREATFSQSKQLLIVQVAVPEDVARGDKVREFMIESLYGANAVAFEFFRQKNMNYPLEDAEKLVSNVEAKLFLEQDAPLNMFFVFKAPSMHRGVIGHLATDGEVYAHMDDNDERAEKCIAFLEKMNCPVFSTVDEIDAHIARLENDD
tara:strand:+ start:142 stop:768 length:627 start_codon:yes stop_codon:yes gene_type:complete